MLPVNAGSVDPFPSIVPRWPLRHRPGSRQLPGAVGFDRRRHISPHCRGVELCLIQTGNWDATAHLIVLRGESPHKEKRILICQLWESSRSGIQRSFVLVAIGFDAFAPQARRHSERLFQTAADQVADGTGAGRESPPSTRRIAASKISIFQGINKLLSVNAEQ